MKSISLFFAIAFLAISLSNHLARAEHKAEVTNPETSSESGTLVYVYREKALFGLLSDYELAINGKSISYISNNSYLTLKLKPGHYKISISISTLSIPTYKVIHVKDKSLYFEYGFPVALLSNGFNLGAQITEKTEAEIKEVNSDATPINNGKFQDLTDWAFDLPPAKAGFQRTELGVNLRNQYPPTYVFDVDDLRNVPLIGTSCREKYVQWLRQVSPKAFFIGPQSECGFAWGTKPSQLISSTDPVERAYEACKSVRKNECWAYAIDDDVVWKN